MRHNNSFVFILLFVFCCFLWLLLLGKSSLVVVVDVSENATAIGSREGVYPIGGWATNSAGIHNHSTSRSIETVWSANFASCI